MFCKCSKLLLLCTCMFFSVIEYLKLLGNYSHIAIPSLYNDWFQAAFQMRLCLPISTIAICDKLKIYKEPLESVLWFIL